MSRAAPAALLVALAVAWPIAPVAQPAPERAPEIAPVPAPKPTGQDAAGGEGATGGAGAGEPAAETAPDEPAGGVDKEQPTAGTPADDAAGAQPDGPADEPATAEPADAEPEGPPVPELLAESELELGTCLGRLEVFGTLYERAPAVSDEAGACGIANPVRVIEIVPGVALAPPGIMRCEAAAALAEWVARFALPASGLLPERGPLVEVVQGSTYVCRGIGNASAGDLSEHAFGNAVDVMSFGFARGAPIPVEPREREGTAAAAFQHTVRAAACLSFATVLGPGVEAHEDHLHLDVKARESGYRYCR